jgi:hypothetical protein
MVEDGYAEKDLKAQSGYPSIYRMQIRMFPLLMRKGISPMIWYGLKINVEMFNEDLMDYATITLWDQS